MRALHFSHDIQEFLRLLAKHEVKYVIVGGEAVIYHGHARLTGDIDLFYERSQGNVKVLFAALNEFWENNVPGIEEPAEMLEPGVIIQFGVPPNRVDLINTIDGVQFEEAWLTKVTVQMRVKKERAPIHYLGLDQLIKNKEVVGRHKDLEDLRYLKKAKERTTVT